MLQNCSYLIGDSMLTTLAGSPFPSVKPIFSHNDPHGMGFEIVGQRQKIVQTSANSVFAWSGKESSAAKFFNAITDIDSDFCGTLDDYIAATQDVWLSIGDNMLSVFSAYTDGNVHGLNTLGPTRKLYQHRRTVCAGSAWEELAGVHMRDFPDGDLKYIEEPLGLAALAMMYDQSSTSFLKKKAGGVFEAAVVDASGARKLQNYMIVPIRLYSDCAIVAPQWIYSNGLFDRCTMFSLINYREFLIRDNEFIEDHGEKTRRIFSHVLVPPNYSEEEIEQVNRINGTEVFPVDPKILIFNFVSVGHGGTFVVGANPQHKEYPFFDGKEIKIRDDFFGSIAEKSEEIRSRMETSRFFTD